MDYWTDTDDSVYRPRYTIGELKKFSNFSYLNKQFVLSFNELDNNLVEITANVKDSSEVVRYVAKSLVLSAGTMGSARIVLRSLKKYGAKIPILTNTYTYMPSLNFNMLGVVPVDRRSSHGQLSLIYFSGTSKRGPVLSNFYSYRTLLTFKLLKEAPLPQRECLKIMRALMPIFGIITIFHRDSPAPSKYCVLHKAAGTDPDRLEIRYRSSEEDVKRYEASEREIKKFYRKLGCWPIKSIRRAPGSSIHYSGTLPMTKNDKELTCNAEGRLSGTRSVYIADGSVISPLPSIFPTFSIMAIADRVGTLLARRLRNE